MLTEEQKYKASIFKIIGIAMLSPFGRIFLDPLSFCLKYGPIFSASYIIFSALVMVVGFIFIEKGRDIIDTKR